MEQNTYAYPATSSCQLLRAADLVMDPDKGEVRRDSKMLNLEGREFQLLEYFLRNKNRIVSRSELVRDVWKQEISVHTMDARISALRKKIDSAFSVKLLYTISRKGYQLLDNNNLIINKENNHEIYQAAKERLAKRRRSAWRRGGTVGKKAGKRSTGM